MLLLLVELNDNYLDFKDYWEIRDHDTPPTMNDFIQYLVDNVMDVEEVQERAQ